MRLSPFWNGPFGKELSSRVKHLDSFVTWIRHIDLVGFGINGDRSWVIKLTVAVSFATPDREYLAFGVELNNSCSPLINDINRVVTADSDPAGSVEPGVRPLPLCDELSVGGEFLNTVLGSVRHVDVASI